MFIALVHFGCILPLMTVSAIALLVCRVVGGCLSPNSSGMILMYTASHAMMYSPASTASVAGDMMFLNMCNVEYRPIVRWNGCVAGEEEVSSSSAACFRLA